MSTATDAAAGPARSRWARALGDATLRRRLQGLLLASALVVVAFMVLGIAALDRARDAQAAVTGPYYRAVVETDAAYLSVVNAETAVRGYLLTGDPAELGPLNELLAGSPEQEARAAQTEKDLAFIHDDAGDDFPILETRDEAAAAAREWYEDFAVPAMAAVDEGGQGAVADAELERGRAMFDEVRVQTQEYIELVKDARAQSIARSTQSLQMLQWALAAFALAPVVVGVLLWVFLRRWVTDPLDRLASDARTVAEGHVDHHVLESGPGEVGAVARDVELMRERLARLLAEAREAQAEVEASHALLREQAEDLRRSNRDLEQFAYVASHDLQEPLRKVASFTQLLAKRYEGQLDERADQYIAFAVDGAKRMQRLINDLLGFSRVGRIGGELTDVDLGALLDGVVEDLSGPVEESGAVVTHGELPVVRGEAPLLTQLFVNLVGNAIKFRDPGRTPTVHVEARDVGDHWELSCHDNGIGIDAQYADRVFVIFQRLHAKDVYEGTGIGLALCKKIVEYHGGTIWVDPDVEQGTTIRWTLPQERAEDETARERPDAEPEVATVGGGGDETHE